MTDQHSAQKSPWPPQPPVNALALRQPYQLQTELGGVPDDEDIEPALTLGDLIRIVLKHKWTLIFIVTFATGIAIVNTLLARPTYRATTVIQIDRPTRVVEFAKNNADMETEDVFALRTQYELLRSRSLAERVIDELRLDHSRAAAAATAPTAGAAPRAEPSQFSLTGISAIDSFVGRVVAGYRKISTPSTNDVQLLNRESVISAFLLSLVIDPIPNSRLVRLSVDNADPELAARIANTSAQLFISSGQERRSESSAYTKTFLEDQIKQMKERLEESEKRLNQFTQEKQILTLDDKTNVVSQTYTDYAGALSTAEQERIKVEAQFNELKRNPAGAALVLDSQTIRTYKEQKAKLELEYQQNARIYKADFPKMLQIKAQVEEMDSQIKAEMNNVVSSVQAQYEAAVKQEAMLRERLGNARKQVLTSQDHGAALSLLKREVDTNRELYDGLLQQLKQTKVSSEGINSNISVVDRAQAPLFPYKPDLRTNALGGLAVGLFLGLCAVFLLEYIDDSIKAPDEIERVLGIALMGIIPYEDKKRGVRDSVGMDVHTDPRSTIAEAYRSVRTSLQFSTSHGAPTRLLITSTTRDEGKSTTAIALAINFAQMGERILLIDGDMRNPSIHKLMDMPNERGLSNLLSTSGAGETLIQPTVVPNLSVLTAGPPPPNPVDLLIGPKLLTLLDKAEELGFDHVIVDGPPVLGIADSIVLGNHIPDILFIVRASSTRRGGIRDALRRLKLAGLTPRGVLLTQLRRRNMPETYSYYYYGYGSGNVPKAQTPQADAQSS